MELRMFQNVNFSRVFFFLVRALLPGSSVIERLAYWQQASSDLSEWFKTDEATGLVKRAAASVYSAFVEHFADCTGDVHGAIPGELNNAGTIVMEERQTLAGTAKGHFVAATNGALLRDIIAEENASKRKKAKNPFSTDNGAQYTVELTGENGKGEASVSVAYHDNSGVIVGWFRTVYNTLILSNGDTENPAEDLESTVTAEKRKAARAALDTLEVLPDVLTELNDKGEVPTLTLLDKAYALTRIRQQLKALQTTIAKTVANEKATTAEKLAIVCTAEELARYEASRSAYWRARQDSNEEEAQRLLWNERDNVTRYCERTYTDGKRTVRPFRSIAITWEAEYDKQASIKKNLTAKPAYDYGTDKEASFENDVLRYMKNYGVAREIAENVVSVHNKKNNVTYETATV